MKQGFRHFLSWFVLLLVVIGGTVFFWLIRDALDLLLINYLGIENTFQQYFIILGTIILLIIVIKYLFMRNISITGTIKKIFKP